MIAFMLVFATIIGSVALLSTFGIQAMTDYQEGEQLQNAERAMISLSDNFDDVLRHDGIEQRYGELSLREGTITTGNSGTDVTIEDKNGVSLHDTNLGTFAYQSGSDTIAYEGGGVFRSDGEGSVVLKRPSLACREDNGVAIISLIKVASEKRSIQSSGGLGVTMTETDRNRTVYDNIDTVTVTANTDSSYEGAWNDVYNSDDKWTCEADRAVVTIVTVDIEY
ncbi:hypothetical protein HYG81_15425 [Natrinema zhouii]|nr:hypothetical protein [Natrinema zhouii]QLK25459.2 hypothetical protein HYG81_15425 [Natrinema zhouii]